MIEKECEYQTRIEELIAEIAKDQERLSSLTGRKRYSTEIIRSIL